MNKVFLGLILTVCILGMALVMLNDRLGRKTIQPRPQASMEAQAPEVTPAEIEAAARARELAEASLAQGPREPEPASEPARGITEPAPIPDRNVEAEANVPPQRQPESVREPPKPAAPALAQKPAEPAPVPTPAPPQAPPREEKVVKAEKPSGNTITRFVIYARDKGATVRLGGNGKMDYSTMTLTDPDRIVVDLPGGWKFPPHPGVPKNELVSAVRVAQSGDKTRVVIDLRQPARKVVLVPFKNGDGVDVRVDK